MPDVSDEVIFRAGEARRMELAGEALRILGANDGAHLYDLTDDQLAAVRDTIEQELERRESIPVRSRKAPDGKVIQLPRPIADRGCGCACNFGGFCGGCGHAGCGLRR